MTCVETFDCAAPGSFIEINEKAASKHTTPKNLPVPVIVFFIEFADLFMIILFSQAKMLSVNIHDSLDPANFRWPDST
jgi:hypothetical protein